MVSLFSPEAYGRAVRCPVDMEEGVEGRRCWACERSRFSTHARGLTERFAGRAWLAVELHALGTLRLQAGRARFGKGSNDARLLGGIAPWGHLPDRFSARSHRIRVPGECEFQGGRLGFARSCEYDWGDGKCCFTRDAGSGAG